jgi:hypothetical protein
MSVWTISFHSVLHQPKGTLMLSALLDSVLGVVSTLLTGIAGLL